MSLLQLSNGCRMNVDVVAQQAPQDVVFIHGNLASNTWWQPTLAQWRQAAPTSGSGRLICTEWRGFGKSSAPETEAQLHPSQLADDLILAMQELKVQKAHFVSHSTGGIIALFACSKAPQLFDKLILLDSVGARGIAFPDEMFDVFKQMASDREFCATIMAGTIHKVDTSTALFQRIVDDAFGAAPLNWHGVLANLRGIDIREKIKTIRQPTLVLHGELDQVLPIADSRELAELMPNAEFRELKGHGHSTNVEDPVLFTQLVKGFLFSQENNQHG